MCGVLMLFSLDIPITKINEKETEKNGSKHNEDINSAERKKNIEIHLARR